MRTRTAAEYDSQIRQLAKQVSSICRPAQACNLRSLSLLTSTGLLVQRGARDDEVSVWHRLLCQLIIPCITRMSCPRLCHTHSTHGTQPFAGSREWCSSVGAGRAAGGYDPARCCSH